MGLCPEIPRPLTQDNCQMPLYKANPASKLYLFHIFLQSCQAKQIEGSLHITVFFRSGTALGIVSVGALVLWIDNDWFELYQLRQLTTIERFTQECVAVILFQ